MKYHIRRAIKDDVSTLTQFRLLQLKETGSVAEGSAVAVATMRHLLSNLGVKLLAWVIEVNGEVVGCVFADAHVGMPTSTNLTGHFAELLGAYIKPEFRNHTLGTVLLTEAVMDMRQNSEFEYVKAYVTDDSEHILKRIGFSESLGHLRLNYNRR